MFDEIKRRNVINYNSTSIRFELQRSQFQFSFQDLRCPSSFYFILLFHLKIITYARHAMGRRQNDNDDKRLMKTN